MCVLPVPGRPCSSSPRLRCCPAASSRSPCCRDADRVPLDRLEHAVGQDDLLTGERRAREEREQLVAAVLAGPEGQHLPAEEVVLGHQALDAVAHLGGGHPRRREDLQPALLEPPLRRRAADGDQHRLATRRARADQPQLDGFGRVVRADRRGRVVDRAELVHPLLARDGEHPDQVLVRALTAGDAEPVHGLAVFGEVGLDPALDVRVLPHRPVAGDDHDLRQWRPEVPGHLLDEFTAPAGTDFVSGCVDDPGEVGGEVALCAPHTHHSGTDHTRQPTTLGS